ncbi:hypothetical protein Pst134EA_007520 [Puccinia striiformis f. sp. tritici]|uniref:hypothetical protein n=1 Tax=Puccinia striiformis f. sp. tritici TaxID=168172 RepID=UPI0020074858|nr:hypothetical protein Pst134EA_007520 [Puccinia striiformis f. sp. tritici]KAH9470255.1 hypothetical protein Pst134EA_007520 [Puccinia striiformis f. sp. tritici]KAI9619864.1 hypothetical protein KEM48_008478 [Puccinia striiformis f. sp. tritici PST-130]
MDSEFLFPATEKTETVKLNSPPSSSSAGYDTANIPRSIDISTCVSKLALSPQPVGRIVYDSNPYMFRCVYTKEGNVYD